jgi:hypothetical protein
MADQLQSMAFVEHAKATLGREALAEVWVGLTKALNLSLFLVEGDDERETILRLAPGTQVAEWVKASPERMLATYGQLANGQDRPPDHWSVAVTELFWREYTEHPCYGVDDTFRARAGYLVPRAGSEGELGARLAALAADVCARPDYAEDDGACVFDQVQEWPLARMACCFVTKSCSRDWAAQFWAVRTLRV